MNRQKVLYCFLFINVTFFMMNVTAGAWQNWSTSSNKMVTLALLEAPTNPPNFRGSSNPVPASRNVTGGTAKALHPFDQIRRRLGQFDWDPLKLDEYIRQYWNTERSFLRYEVDKDENTRTILTTSCLHNAAWIIVALLELETRPTLYRGVFKLPANKDLIVYDNTQRPPSTLANPAIQSIRDFVDSRPLDEAIILQVDMHLLRSNPDSPYIDHHFAMHIYKDQVSVYQGWQDNFNLIDWMEQPGAYKLRYPMPLGTFLAHYEKVLTYTKEEDEIRERLESAWKLFGMTDTFVYGRKEVLDPVVRYLRYPWVVPLISFWPHAEKSKEFLSLSKL